jgi:hypothetical protein
MPPPEEKAKQKTSMKLQAMTCSSFTGLHSIMSKKTKLFKPGWVILRVKTLLTNIVDAKLQFITKLLPNFTITELKISDVNFYIMKYAY